jgi:hypothetical protein
MKTIGGVTKCGVVVLVAGLFMVMAGCAAQSGASSSNLSNIEGTWSWKQGSNDGELTLKKDGNSYTGTLNDLSESTYGDKITNVTVQDGHIKFTRDGKYGLQEWEGTLKMENGVLKIVDGQWTKKITASGTFTAEKTK